MENFGFALMMAMIFCAPLVAVPCALALRAIIKRTLKWPERCPLTLIDLAVPFAVAAIWVAVYETAQPPKSLANIAEMFYLGIAFDALLAARLWRCRANPSVKRRDALISLALMCALSVLSCLAYPCLPE